MPFLADRVLDLGLNVFDTEADRLDICSSEPTTYAAATGAASLGNKTGAAGSIIGVPSSRSPDGRRVTVAEITDGSVTAGGAATHWAISDTAASRLLATGDLAGAHGVTAANVFTLGAFDISIPGAA